MGPSGGAHGLLVKMKLVYHGRLAPRLELSHHQFLSAFKKVFFRSLIIGAYFRECESTCQGENIFFDKSRECIERAKASIDSGRASSKLDALIDFTRQCDFFVRRAI